MIRTQRAHLHVAALSHPGMTGKNNEDRFAVSSYMLNEEHPTPVVFAVVSDGIGGHRAGEVAAELAVNHITQVVAESNGKKPLKILEEAVHTASEAIAHHSASKDDQHGMGATCVCAWIIGHKLYAAHVGDSRLFLLRGGEITQLTVDHTWVQEAFEKGLIKAEQMRTHPNVHVIRRYLGAAKLPEVDFRIYLRGDQDDEAALANQGMTLLSGDTLLLCSDGLTDMIWPDEILKLVLMADDQKTAVQDLVNLANERGGHDNITVVLLNVPRAEDTVKRRKSLWKWLLGE